MKLYSTSKNLQVIYEDNHLIAVNKRSGDIVQGDKTQDVPLSDVVKQYLAEKYNKPGAVYLGVVHRLDRPTSGLVLFARTSKALSRLNALFASRNPEQLKKIYWAVVCKNNLPTEATLTHYLLRNPKQNKSYAFDIDGKDRKKAILHYKVIKVLDRYQLLEITLETGRHHQIRAQLASLGVFIKGDLKYGADRSNPNKGIHLHAKNLTIYHPVKKQMLTLEAPLPIDPLWSVCDSL